MARGEATRDRMTATAASLFHRQGYNATGLQQIVEESGTPKGSLYYHFPGGKEELASEAVRLGGRVMSNAIKAALDSSDDVAGALEQLAELFARNLERSGFREGCPVATVTLEAAAESEPIQGACGECFGHFERRIEERLIGEGHAPERARELATLLIAAFEGALLLARAKRDTAPLAVMARSLTPTLRAPSQG